MKLIKKNNERVVYNSKVEGLEISFQKITDVGLVLTLVKGNKKIDILFEDEEIEPETIGITISDDNTQEHSFYDLSFNDKYPYSFDDEEEEF